MNLWWWRKSYLYIFSVTRKTTRFYINYILWRTIIFSVCAVTYFSTRCCACHKISDTLPVIIFTTRRCTCHNFYDTLLHLSQILRHATKLILVCITELKLVPIVGLFDYGGRFYHVTYLSDLSDQLAVTKFIWFFLVVISWVTVF